MTDDITERKVHYIDVPDDMSPETIQNILKTFREDLSSHKYIIPE